MIFEYETLKHMRTKVNSRADVSGHGAFHWGLEGQYIKAAGEGREAG